jgi:adenine specific DNA methylase Mod
MNQLWYGDNLTIMQGMRKHSVDLIYLDPPFNSKQSYNLLYKTMTGKPVPEQVEAFCDTWEMDPQKEAIARSMPVLMREHGIDDYYVEFWRLWMQALKNTQPHLLAYLIFMVQRLLHMKSILRPTGSIYLHCDPTASHYIKVMMDGIFGHENFRNEIVWKRTTTKTDVDQGAINWPRVHDILLYYTNSKKSVAKFDQPFSDYAEEYIDNFYRFVDQSGRRYTLDKLTAPGSGTRGHPKYELLGVERYWVYGKEKMQALVKEGRVVQTKPGTVPRYKRYLDEVRGVAIGDVWTDIKPIQAHAKERLGYPTQKPMSLLDRIITASSSVGEVVFDPFCGCGTTIYSAHKNARQWIGCDIAILSIKLVREVLTEKYRLVEGSNFTVDGIPTSVDGAQELFNKDPSTFQNWFVERVGGFPMQKKSADRGIDGRIYFETREGLREMMIQVKGGKHVRPTDVRDLRGVLEREENAEMAGFLSIMPPTKAMLSEASEAGTYEYAGGQYPRIQFLTTEDVLVAKREFHMPTRVNTKISTGQQSLPL